MDKVSVLDPKVTPVVVTELARDLIVAPDGVAEMSKTPVLASVTPADVAIVPEPDNAKVPPLTVVAPV